MKKMLSLILALATIFSLSVTALAVSPTNASTDVPVVAAHTHSFKTISSSTSEDYCYANGTHTATWSIRRCSCGIEVCTNTKNSCGSCPTGGSMR